MKLSWKNRVIFAFLAIILAFGLSAQDIPEPMRPYRMVNDFAGIFSTTQQQALEHKLLAYNDSTSTQIYVVTIDDLHGYDISDFSFRLGEKWGIGQKSKNNGAVILIKPRIGNNRGKVFIANGYGLEEKITDAFTGQVIRRLMIPHFKNNDYYSGVNAAVDAIIERLSGSFSPDDDEADSGISLLTIIFIILFVIVILSMFSGGGDQHIDSDGHRNSSGDFFFPPFSGGRGGFGSGGSFGGGGFGGFGGGGGGSFGGGGAGGSW